MKKMYPATNLLALFLLLLFAASGDAWAAKKGSTTTGGGNALCDDDEEGCESTENGSLGGPAAGCDYGPGGTGADILECMLQTYESQGFNGPGVNYEIQQNGAPYIQIYGPGNTEPESLCYGESNTLTAHTWVEVNTPGLIAKIRKPTQAPSGSPPARYDPPARVTIEVNDDEITVLTAGILNALGLRLAIYDGLVKTLGAANVDQTNGFFIILADSTGVSPTHLSHYSSDTGYTRSEIELGPNAAWNSTNCTQEFVEAGR